MPDLPDECGERRPPKALPLFRGSILCPWSDSPLCASPAPPGELVYNCGSGLPSGDSTSTLTTVPDAVIETSGLQSPAAHLECVLTHITLLSHEGAGPASPTLCAPPCRPPKGRPICQRCPGPCLPSARFRGLPPARGERGPQPSQSPGLDHSFVKFLSASFDQWIDTGPVQSEPQL